MALTQHSTARGQIWRVRRRVVNKVANPRWPSLRVQIGHLEKRSKPRELDLFFGQDGQDGHLAIFKEGYLEMDMQTLLNELNAGGFRIEPRDDGLAVHGPTERLTAEHKQALRQHKQALRQLACIPYEQAEREAIRWADTEAADDALSQALADWDDFTRATRELPPVRRYANVVGCRRQPQVSQVRR